MIDIRQSRLYHDGYLFVAEQQKGCASHHGEFQNGCRDAEKDHAALTGLDKEKLLRAADRLWLYSRQAEPKFFRPRYARLFLANIDKITKGMRDVNHPDNQGLPSRRIPIGSLMRS